MSSLSLSIFETSIGRPQKCMQNDPGGKELKLLFLLLSGMKKFEYKGKQWHEECFCCMECKEPIRNKSFIPRDEQVVCVPCYEDKYAQRCTKCVGVSETKTRSFSFYHKNS